MNQKYNNKYNSSNHCSYLCQYHLIWTPKFRFNVLSSEIQSSLKQIFSDIAKDYDYSIIEMEIMSDHVHLFVGSNPTVAPSDIVRTFKSISAIKLFKEYEHLKQFYSRCGVLWSKGKFISTIGSVSAETVKKYIQNQKQDDNS